MIALLCGAAHGCAPATADLAPQSVMPPTASGSTTRTTQLVEPQAFKGFPNWCSSTSIGMASCPTFVLLPYNATVATDAPADPMLGAAGFFATPARNTAVPATRMGELNLYQTGNLPTLYAAAGPQPKPFVFSFLYRQHPLNSVNNDFSRVPFIALRFSIAENFATDLMPLNLQAGPTTSRAPLIIAGSTVTSVEFRTNTTAWQSFNASFALQRTCVQCRVVIELRYADGWVSYTGNQHFFGNITLHEPAVALPLRTTHHITQQEVVTIPVMPTVPAGWPRMACPHEQPGMAPGHDAATWGAVGVLQAGTSITPANTCVLRWRLISWPPNPPLAPRLDPASRS